MGSEKQRGTVDCLLLSGDLTPGKINQLINKRDQDKAFQMGINIIYYAVTNYVKIAAQTRAARQLQHDLSMVVTPKQTPFKSPLLVNRLQHPTQLPQLLLKLLVLDFSVLLFWSRCCWFCWACLLQQLACFTGALRILPIDRYPGRHAWHRCGAGFGAGADGSAANLSDHCSLAVGWRWRRGSLVRIGIYLSRDLWLRLFYLVVGLGPDAHFAWRSLEFAGRGFWALALVLVAGWLLEHGRDVGVDYYEPLIVIAEDVSTEHAVLDEFLSRYDDAKAMGVDVSAGIGDL